MTEAGVSALIGLGGNLGAVAERFAAAQAALGSLGRVRGRAPDFWSLPLGPEQPIFRNSALWLETKLPARQLLTALHKIESDQGRQRDLRWGPRTLDLDLLYYGDAISYDSNCRIPHPHVRERAFALGPAAVLAPEHRDPEAGRCLAALYQETRRDIMEALTSKAELRAFRKRCTGRLAFVPTMGALHEGHLSLVRQARELGDHVLVSIFVNPLQFGPQEDLARYPRDPEGDRRKLLELGVDGLFEIESPAMYGAHHETRIVQERLPRHLCGLSRSGHFEGVMTVVAKLLLLASPDVMLLGRKDFQQTVVLQRMITDLDFPVELHIAPTTREADGLALSSRNAYLSPEQRAQACCLSQALFAGERAFAAGETDPRALERLMAAELAQARELVVEYCTLVDPNTLDARSGAARAGDVALVAGRLGKTRLIDNRLLGAVADPRLPDPLAENP